MTRTYVILSVSLTAYAEIRDKLLAADYGHVLHETDEHGIVLDMHGIALAEEKEESNMDEAREVPQQFRKRPIVVAAVQWRGPIEGISIDALQAWGVKITPTEHWGAFDGHPDKWTLMVWVEPSKQWVRCPFGFWIIQDVKGAFYPCDPDVFAETYERVLEPPVPDTGTKV